MKSYMAKTGEVERSWHLIDLDGVVLGRAASQIARLLRGKHKPQFTPHIDTGDFVVVVNASKVRLTGDKAQKKMYYRVGRKIGHMKEINAGTLRERNPERLVMLAVKGMLPRTRLGRAQLRKFKVYRGPDHPHEAQKPQPFAKAEG